MACGDETATLVGVIVEQSDGRSSRFDVSVVDGTRPAERAAGRNEAADVLLRAVGPDLVDDRFEPNDTTDDGSVLVLAHHDGLAVAYVTAASSRGRLQLDTVADRRLVGEIEDSDATDRAVHDLINPMIQEATTEFDRRSAVPSTELVFELWGRPAQAWHHSLAGELELEPKRSLYQMRSPLPIAPDRTKHEDRTRAIDPGTDTEALLAINNRAFSYHPDQSDQKIDDLHAAFSAPSFRPASVRILDPQPDDPRASANPMVGFCWTKIHPERPGREALGEIYVIAVDPEYHGEGHGIGLTTAGLRWLTDQGLRRAMLYVESDNAAAVATYRKLGFTIHATYTAWGHR